VFGEAGFASLLEAARGDAEWAWAAVYRELAPIVLRYLSAHRAREPEDVLGEVFVQVVRKLGDFAGDERDFRAWVLTIARTRLIDEWRRDRRSPVDCVPDDALAACAGVGDAGEDALRQLTDERVRAIIERLSRDQRDVLFRSLRSSSAGMVRRSGIL
jgi:RNA polymerase sigma factor (sigma-70 family)